MDNFHKTLYGAKIWTDSDGKIHREDGPAVEESNGSKEWYIHGVRHRLDGPAIEWSTGYRCWYVYGEKLNCKDNEEFFRLLKLKSFL
jgi:hypothetical protein